MYVHTYHKVFKPFLCVCSMETQNETNGSLDNPAQWRKSLKTNITTTVRQDFWSLAKQYNIAWNDALEFGIHFLVADKDGGLGFDYPHNNLQNKLHKMVKNFEAKAQECNALRDQLEGVDPTEDLKNLDDVFKAEVTKDE